ncbi:MAG: hypothetical protein KME21_14590 [Desmonostoc vinosum HA7617-LM4]|nr:hypothetical protein [Desmonostoc vinosum HA7617-LM4]
MVIVVIVINTLISLILLYTAGQVWQLKQRLAFISDRLTFYERCTHAALYKAPENIYAGQQGIHNLMQQNQALQAQIQQVRQIISLLFFGRQVWQRNVRRSILYQRKR